MRSWRNSFLTFICLVAISGAVLRVRAVDRHTAIPLVKDPLAAFSVMGANGAGFSLGGPTHSTGTTSIWATCAAQGMTDVPTDAQLQVMRGIMATRMHRLAHALWHLMRTSLYSQDRAELIQSYGQAWDNPHQECPLPKSTVDAEYNSFGEDFLFMHRGMVNAMQSALIQAGLPCIAPWATLPKAGDANWPVPDANGQGVKSAQALSVMQDWLVAFQDPQWLKIHSLAQLGFMMEVSLHNNMHMRWATLNPPPGFSDGANIPYDGNFPSDWSYDNPSYDWLADTYSSHVNKHFWKLHGLIDQVIDRWAQANGYTSVAEDCQGNERCYQWRGTWVGEPMSHGASGMQEMEMTTNSGTVSGKAISLQDRMAGFQRGMLTDEILNEEGARETHSRWRNDPEDFVNQRFCQ